VNNAEFVSERRLVNRLKGFWDLAKGTEDLPPYTKFSKAAIDDLWTNCILVSVNSSSKQIMYKYEHVGKSAVEAFGKDLTGAYANSYEKSLMHGSNLMKYLDKSVEERSFLVSQGQFVNAEDKIIKFRDCILPFADINKNISHLVVGLSWRSF
jgi:hypothetical protein